MPAVIATLQNMFLLNMLNFFVRFANNYWKAETAERDCQENKLKVSF